MLTSALTADMEGEPPDYDSDDTPDMDWQMQVGEYAHGGEMGLGVR